jgi:hypothetical protein
MTHHHRDTHIDPNSCMNVHQYVSPQLHLLATKAKSTGAFASIYQAMPSSD